MEPKDGRGTFPGGESIGLSMPCIAPWVGRRIGTSDDGGMDTNALFTTALGLQSPWEVKTLDFGAAPRRLDILVDFQKGTSFPCPVCGQLSKVHDTEEKTWRHLDFFQHAAYLTVRVPRCKCDEHGVKRVPVPWAREGSGFTLLFEAPVMTLVQQVFAGIRCGEW